MASMMTAPRRPYVRRMRMGQGKKRAILMRFRRLIAAFAKAKKSGNRTRAKMLARQIRGMVRNHPKLRSTRAFARFRSLARPMVTEDRFSQFEPSFDESQAFTPEGEIVAAPETFEDESDMSGYGFLHTASARGQRSMLDNLYLAGLIGGTAIALTGKTKKNKQLGTTIAGASLALTIFKSIMDRRAATEAVMNGYGELEIMDGMGAMHENPHCMNGYGELEIMDGYGAPGMYSGSLGSPINVSAISG